MEALNQSKKDMLTGSLRSLYQSLGYTRFSMRRFEEYALYLENKRFLKSESVLAFTNPDGKLMALKPDVTLSIVKHAPKGRDALEKVYYKESVYRLAPTAREFVEIEQMGVEALGAVDAYTVAEVLRLAIETLRLAGLDHVLDVSHMGFAAGLMDAAGLDAEQQARLFQFIRQKNAHELAAEVARMGIPPQYADKIDLLAGLAGSFPETLRRAEAMVVCPAMAQALQELHTLHAQLTALGLADCLQLDFSMLNDLGYYNGLVFQGYVQGSPRVVLSGGRYDLLMRRFDKQGDAIGFSLYLDELTHVLAEPSQWDADVLALYQPQDDVAALNAAVFALAAGGQRVLAATQAPRDLRARKTLRFDGQSFQEVT